MSFGFAGKTALVTGASSGIGEAFARALASRGANLVLVARSEAALSALAVELRAKHRVRIDVVAMDLAKAGAAERLHARTTEAGIGVDLLINNAGFGKWGGFLEFERVTYADMLALNVQAPVELCHLYLPDMLGRDGCGVINVASTAAFIPVPWASVYSASKSFVLYFTEALHGEYAERGVRILALCPGGTKSNFAAVASDAGSPLVGAGQAPDEVADAALEALSRNRSHLAPGRGNKVTPLLARLLPRATVLRLSGRAWRRMIGHAEAQNA
ncbi:MAG: SDR family oxidoreductase [Phenylobacterium sp.]|uniref:SDR family NAD(P)-dependent oxidoreductase n=1 Tax=Phenylobacterium sp. TaxID=1871053 RepID=UPI0027342324|nr:SDR family oxidoreductase [Phenylobacterium sp.]MDP3747371.1 SDR family oxidoreductase [Phenylobacterium sp.]